MGITRSGQAPLPLAVLPECPPPQCYLNAVLTALLFLPPIARAILDPLVSDAAASAISAAAAAPAGLHGAPSVAAPVGARLSQRVIRHGQDLRMFHALHAVFLCKFAGQPPGPALLRDFKKAAASYDAIFASSAQQDAHEFLVAVLAVLHEELEALAPALVSALPDAESFEGAAHVRAVRTATSVLRDHLRAGAGLIEPLPGEAPSAVLQACATLFGLVADPGIRGELREALHRLAARSPPQSPPNALLPAVVESLAHSAAANDAASDGNCERDGGAAAAVAAAAVAADEELIQAALNAVEQACERYSLSATLPTVRTVNMQITATLCCDNADCRHRRQHVESFRDLALDLPLRQAHDAASSFSTAKAAMICETSAGTKRRADAPLADPRCGEGQPATSMTSSTASISAHSRASAAPQRQSALLQLQVPSVIDLCCDDDSVDVPTPSRSAAATAAPAASVAPAPNAHAPLHIRTLLNAYFAERVLELTCEKCGHATVRVSYAVTALPRVLILQLKRFDVDATTGVCVKRLDPVSFPEELDFTAFLADRSHPGALPPLAPGAAVSLQLESAFDHEFRTLHLRSVRLPPPLDLQGLAATDEALNACQRTFAGEEPSNAIITPALRRAAAISGQGQSFTDNASLPAPSAVAPPLPPDATPTHRGAPASLALAAELPHATPRVSVAAAADAEDAINSAGLVLRNFARVTPGSSKIMHGLAASQMNTESVRKSGGSIAGQSKSGFYGAGMHLGSTAKPPLQFASAAAAIERHRMPPNSAGNLAVGMRQPRASTGQRPSNRAPLVIESSDDEGSRSGTTKDKASAFTPIVDGTVTGGALYGSGKTSGGGGGGGHGGAGATPSKRQPSLLGALSLASPAQGDWADAGGSRIGQPARVSRLSEEGYTASLRSAPEPQLAPQHAGRTIVGAERCDGIPSEITHDAGLSLSQLSEGAQVRRAITESLAPVARNPDFSDDDDFNGIELLGDSNTAQPTVQELLRERQPVKPAARKHKGVAPAGAASRTASRVTSAVSRDSDDIVVPLRQGCGSAAAATVRPAVAVMAAATPAVSLSLAEMSTEMPEVIDIASSLETSPLRTRQPRKSSDAADVDAEDSVAASASAAIRAPIVACLVGRPFPPPPQRAMFRLAGVIRHEGTRARSGHYTTDTRSDFSVRWPPPAAASTASGQAGAGSVTATQWSRYDDTAVMPKTAEQVLGYDGQRHAYVLLYTLVE